MTNTDIEVTDADSMDLATDMMDEVDAEEIGVYGNPEVLRKRVGVGQLKQVPGLRRQYASSKTRPLAMVRRSIA